MKTVVIPEVVGALGTVKKGMVSNGQATSIIMHDFSSLYTIIIIFNYNGIFIIIIPFYRCSKIPGEAGKQEILQQMFGKFKISNGLPNRYFPKIDVECP